MITLGVIADTHIPDRIRTLNPDVIPIFRDAKVDAILHAGDISTQRVLSELETVAPVYAVRGNRDWFFLYPFSQPALPRTRVLDFCGVNVILTHGQGTLWQYLAGHLTNIHDGKKNIERMKSRLCSQFPGADVIIFGHLHQTVNMRVGKTLLFNPGSPHFPDYEHMTPTIGLLRIQEDREIEGQVIPL